MAGRSLIKEEDSGCSFEIDEDRTTQATALPRCGSGFSEAARRAVPGNSRDFRSLERGGSAGVEAGTGVELVASGSSADRHRQDIAPPQRRVEAVRSGEGGEEEGRLGHNDRSGGSCDDR